MQRNYIKWFFYRNLIRLFGIIYRCKDTVFFESSGGKQYSDNPKAISEKLHELYPEMSIVWLLDKNSRYKNIVPVYVKVVNPKTFQHLKALATARCIVSSGNGIMPNRYKKKGQYIISTWHGDRGFKRVAYEKDILAPYKTRDKNYQLTDLFVTASEYGIKRSKDSFLYDGEFLSEGMPRNDDLVLQPQDKIKKKKQELNISEDNKILLFAPTFRGINEKQKLEVDINAVYSKLNTKGEKWICLIRCHPLSVGFDINDEPSFMDVSTYPDMADLLLISDMLITDYSSSSGDFILKNKPIILVHFDYEEYQRTSRALRFTPKDVGYFCVYNNEELLQLIENMTDDMAIEECEKLKKFFGINETGKSAEAVCRRIGEFIKKQG